MALERDSITVGPDGNVGMLGKWIEPSDDKCLAIGFQMKVLGKKGARKRKRKQTVALEEAKLQEKIHGFGEERSSEIV